VRNFEAPPGTTLSLSGSNFLGLILTFNFSKRVKKALFGRFEKKKA
jgi:hypothetical protein